MLNPKTPDERVNYSQENPLKEALTLGLSISVVIVILVISAGWLAEILARNVPPSWEQKLFEKAPSFFKSTANKGTAVETLSGMVDRLKRHSQLENIHIAVDIVCSNTPNAFAVPGYRIGVTSGLIKKVHSETGLAFVLGHELGHFANRDHLRGLGYDIILIGLLSSIDFSGGSLVKRIIDSTFSVASLSYSRKQEKQADDYALKLVLAEYNELRGADELFRRLQDIESFKGIPEIFKTHPKTEGRLQKIQDRIRKISPNFKSGATLPKKHGIRVDKCGR